MNRTKHPLLTAIFISFSILSLSATWLLGTYLPHTDADSVTVELPTLVGTTYAEDDERLPPSLYRVVFDYRTDSQSEPGTILLQTPAPHATRRVISDRAPCTVHLTLSTGAASYTLPPLIGSSAREAAVTLRGAGLTVQIKQITRNDLAPGQIVAVSPPEGTTLHEGEVVTLTESTQTTRSVVRVPDVIGSDAPTANRTLVLRGLKPSASTYQTSTAPQGSVIAQQPLPGTLVPAGTTATLTLSAGGISAADEEMAMEGE